MSCESCELKRIYKLFEEKKRRKEAEIMAQTKSVSIDEKSEENSIEEVIKPTPTKTHKKKTVEPKIEEIAEKTEDIEKIEE